MIELKKIFARWNRGLLFDALIFAFQLTLIRLLTRLSLGFVQHAEEVGWAQTAIGLFLVGLCLLQPVGPFLKRWSFHEHNRSFQNQQSVLTSFLLSIYRFFYFCTMWILAYLAYSFFINTFPNAQSERLEAFVVAGGLVLSVVFVSMVFRYFQEPKTEPRWKFLKTPQAEVLGDLCMFLNVICFQLLFSVYVSSPHFWNLLHKVTRQSSGFLDSISGRLYIAGIAVLLVYFPARIFYLVIDQHRKITWLMMLLANLPFILAVVFYVPAHQELKSLREPLFVVTAADLRGEHEASSEAAVKKYRGQTVNVTGRVQTRFFPRSLELEDEIGLDGSNGYPWVYCAFDEDQVEFAEALEMGQLVTLQCVGSDSWSHGPALKHCQLVR